MIRVKNRCWAVLDEHCTTSLFLGICGTKHFNLAAFQANGIASCKLFSKISYNTILPMYQLAVSESTSLLLFRIEWKIFIWSCKLFHGFALEMSEIFGLAKHFMDLKTHTDPCLA